MTGLEYVNNVCPTTSKGREPEKEDVICAFEDGFSEGVTHGKLRGIWTAIEFLVFVEDQPAMAADLARTMRITRDMAKNLRKGSYSADRNKQMNFFFRNNRFAGEEICVEKKK